MSELLLELFSEEIPARLQRRAAENLKKNVTDALMECGLTYEGAQAHATPRRLALNVVGIPARSADLKEERKGPRVDAPPKAIEGFLKAAGLSSVEDAEVKSDPKKGDFYVATIEKKGVPATALIEAFMPKILGQFPWGKPMRWGSSREQWVRPMRSIAALFAPENEEPSVLNISLGDISASDQVSGHRFLAPEPFSVKRFEDYENQLFKANVMLDLDRRMDTITTDTDQLAFAQGLSVVVEPGLVEEIAGLVEWPVSLMGNFDESFLELPEEVIIKTIKTNQKCFCLRDRQTGKLTNKFILVSNMVAQDGGKQIVLGNEKVIHARLSDAMFFYRNDLSQKLEDRLPKLEQMVFHQKLGSQFERVERIKETSQELAKVTGADAALCARAAELAKADLVTEMVVEIPELQGLIGRYYAIAQGEDASVAEAIEDHYRPSGPSDRVPTNNVAITVALAEKLDLLNGFWSIDEKPTGSRDPFALRRAALGVIRILVENNISYELDVSADLLGFFHDRLKVMLRDQGARYDLVDAIVAPDSRDMLQIVAQVKSLSGMVEQETGQKLLAGYRRAANILSAEEKKSGARISGEIDLAQLVAAEEKALAEKINAARPVVAKKLAGSDFDGAAVTLADLHQEVDAFFENVLVNDDDANIRLNRLRILASLRALMHEVADFSKIEG